MFLILGVFLIFYAIGVIGMLIVTRP